MREEKGQDYHFNTDSFPVKFNSQTFSTAVFTCPPFCGRGRRFVFNNFTFSLHTDVTIYEPRSLLPPPPLLPLLLPPPSPPFGSLFLVMGVGMSDGRVGVVDEDVVVVVVVGVAGAVTSALLFLGLGV